MKKALTIFIFLVVALKVSEAQGLFQTIKGRVVDVDTHQPLPGVNVVVLDHEPVLGTVTDMDGRYELEKVPLGRQSLQFSFMGYEPAMYRELELNSGRELVMNVALKERFQKLEEIRITPEYRKDRAQNNMSALSARSFSVEEASRYAGGWNDPSRLAGSFAGVTMAEGVNDNAIVIRGNAPKGILWRLEGVDIPAPNHLNGVNNGGGIETVFSVNMLDNSDFYTGAFPAEYGNAMSGVFDMAFRNGSNTALKGTFQVGSQGIDISAEGPFRPDGESSFLFNYRYSTMGLVGAFLDGNFGLPAYQDLSFKVHMPSDWGDFSLWGIAGLSEVSFEPDEDQSSWTNTFDNNQYATASDIVASGATHKVTLGTQTYLQSTLAMSYDRFAMESHQWQRDGSRIPLADHHEENRRWMANSTLNHKFGKRHTNRTGIRYTYSHYGIDVSGNPDQTPGSGLITLAGQRGNVMQWQLFSQSKWRLSPAFDVIAGLHSSYFDMNKEFIVEPRISTSWRFKPGHSISLAYGRHSRPEPLRFYEAQNSQGQPLNAGLKVTKSHHLVLGYDRLISSNLKFKAEAYGQALFDVPVLNGTSYSLINYQWDDYFTDPLVNDGTAYNIGMDLTLERYLLDGYYYMLTASIFDSRYVGGDGIRRSTSFNRNYVFNALGGREWQIRGSNAFGINTKLAFMGGNRFTPTDEEASRQSEMVILDDSRAFEWQESPRFFVDLGLTYKINRRHSTHAITLQAKNLLAQEEMFGWAYDFEQQKVVPHGIAMVYPFLTYRIEF